jgi:hypothetical protein
MQTAPFPTLHPEMLPPGTQVGPWRVVGWAGRGVHGAVYRSVRIGQEYAPPVALKLAVLPRDPRFAREVELLSRAHHPHIPRLIEHGEWQHPDGTLHPYIAMEWVDGVPLYDWARLYRPTSQQMLRLLAQLALALQYVHAQDAVHRDVKGDNTLVRRSDSRLFLTDFGSGIYPGADTLTPVTLLPGTPAYRSPEAWLFSLKHNRAATTRYTAQAADDVYALGVTACRLVTGGYPEMGEALKDEHGTWRLESLLLPQALHSARVEPLVRALILRMLAIRPEERGTAAQCAWELERTAASLTDFPSALSVPRARMRSWRPWLATAAVAGALTTWAGWMALTAPDNSPHAARTEPAAAQRKDTGPVGLGQTAASASTGDSPAPSVPEALAADTLPEPLEGQTAPDAKGRCPHKRQVALNGGCWMETPVDLERCEGYSGSMYKGLCYVPVLPKGLRPSTATPTHEP